MIWTCLEMNVNFVKQDIKSRSKPNHVKLKDVCVTIRRRMSKTLFVVSLSRDIIHCLVCYLINVMKVVCIARTVNWSISVQHVYILTFSRVQYNKNPGICYICETDYWVCNDSMEVDHDVGDLASRICHPDVPVSVCYGVSQRSSTTIHGSIL